MLKKVSKRSKGSNFNLTSSVNPLLAWALILIIVIVFIIINFSPLQSLITITKRLDTLPKVVPITHMEVQITDTPIPTTITNESKTYKSESLGIKFSYLSSIANSQYFFVRESGPKVYLYNITGSNQPFQGTDQEFLSTPHINIFWIERLTKNPGQSLQDAIHANLLIGKSEANCFVKILQPQDSAANPTYIRALIDYPRDQNTGYQEIENRAKYCSPYARGHSFAYFFMDPAHSDRYYFVNIGQSNIPSGLYARGTWDDTIEIF